MARPRLAAVSYPPLEGGSKREALRGGVCRSLQDGTFFQKTNGARTKGVPHHERNDIPLPEICCADFDPPSRGTLRNSAGMIRCEADEAEIRDGGSSGATG